ncbi:MAG: recombinase family protein, partial [Ruminococcus sp.]|nr:recombinase family protein [Ruminococcus sp.]
LCAYSVFNTFPVYPLSAKPLILLAFCRYRYHTSLFNKPDFQRMLEDIENGLIGIVIVKDMSRFGRNYILVGITGFSNVNVLYAFCYNNFEVSYKHLRKVILS